MNKFLYGITLGLLFTFSFQCSGQATLNGRKVTLVNTTKDILLMKVDSKDYTLRPNARLSFTFPGIEKSYVKYQGSVLPYRSLDIRDIAKNMQAKNSSSATVDLVPGTVWQAKLAHA